MASFLTPPVLQHSCHGAHPCEILLVGLHRLSCLGSDSLCRLLSYTEALFILLGLCFPCEDPPMTPPILGFIPVPSSPLWSTDSHLRPPLHMTYSCVDTCAKGPFSPLENPTPTHKATLQHTCPPYSCWSLILECWTVWLSPPVSPTHTLLGSLTLLSSI